MQKQLCVSQWRSYTRVCVSMQQLSSAAAESGIQVILTSSAVCVSGGFAHVVVIMGGLIWFGFLVVVSRSLSLDRSDQVTPVRNLLLEFLGNKLITVFRHH